MTHRNFSEYLMQGGQLKNLFLKQLCNVLLLLQPLFHISWFRNSLTATLEEQYCTLVFFFQCHWKLSESNYKNMINKTHSTECPVQLVIRHFYAALGLLFPFARYHQLSPFKLHLINNLSPDGYVIALSSLTVVYFGS